MTYLRGLGSYAGGRSGGLKTLVECGGEEEGVWDSLVDRVEDTLI